MKILVADNNRTITRIVKTALDEEGYSVETANSKEEVLNLIRNDREIGIVLIDTRFETDKDGYYIAKEVKSLKPVQVVMLISALEKPDLDLMEELDITSYITKPIDSRKLIQVISEIENAMKNISPKQDEQVQIVELEEEKKVRQKQQRKLKDEEEVKRVHKTQKDETDEDSADEEKTVISHDWMLDQKEKMLEDISLLFSSIREIFDNIKSIEKEAQGYVKEISGIVSDLKSKIQKVPDPDRVIFEIAHQASNEIYKKIVDQVIDKIYSDLKEDLKSFIAKEIEKIKRDVLTVAKQDFLSGIEGEIFERFISKARSVLYEKIYDAVYHSIKEDFDSAFDRLKRDLKRIKSIVDEYEEGKQQWKYEGKEENKVIIKSEELHSSQKNDKKEEFQSQRENIVNDFFSIEDI